MPEPRLLLAHLGGKCARLQDLPPFSRVSLLKRQVLVFEDACGKRMGNGGRDPGARLVARN